MSLLFRLVLVLAIVFAIVDSRLGRGNPTKGTITRMMKPRSDNHGRPIGSSISYYSLVDSKPYHRASSYLLMKSGEQGGTIKGLKPAPKIIIAGAPAAGKGTQCEVIRNDFGVIHLSTGDILRAAVKTGSELGNQAKAFMDAGQLVPDNLIINVVCERLKQPDCQTFGWLLDGFPRTKAQAEALSAAGNMPDCFVLLDVPEDILVERVTGRRTDPVTGRVYHLKYNLPENEEIRSRLVHRSDDNAETVKIRYREFQAHVNAIKNCYEDKMIWVDGSIDKADVTECVVRSLTSALTIK